MKCRNCGEPIKLCVGPISGCNDGKTYRHADGVMGLHTCKNGKTKAEPVSQTDPKLSECDHALGSDYFRDEQYPYCPKCGEKL